MYKNKKLLLIAAVLGVTLGTVAARYLFVDSWLSLIPWSIAGLFLGFWSTSRKEAVWVGICYGFLLAYMFMVTGYQGVDPVVTKLLPFTVLGMVGAVGGIVLTQLGIFIPRKRRKIT